ncbi:MAG: response regulator, partial [Bryobacteraceae bacterium]
MNAHPNRHQLNEILGADPPNVCILEISDPVERGLAVIPDVLRVDPKLPIVAVLSNDNPELVLRCLRQGASDFLTQPFTVEQVETALRKIA